MEHPTRWAGAARGISKVIILAGGQGTRLPLSARDIPKVLVEVHGKPILQHRLERLARARLGPVRLALGFRAEQIIDFVEKRGLECEWVIEPEPRGTGGGLKLAMAGVDGPCLVFNGDTIADFDYGAIISSHEPGTALMVTHWQEDVRDFGLLTVEDGWIREFLEKPRQPAAGHINAGCYILHPRDIVLHPATSFMLETDIFPRLAAAGRLKNFAHRGFWEDLGTEERLGRFCDLDPSVLWPA